MAAYKKQHFLPVAYLGQFGRPPDRALRQRAIWRVSETHAGEVPVGSQCQEDYFYSKARARFCETYFGAIEGSYAGMMAKLGRRKPLTKDEMFRFFLCAVDFYARGAKFRARDADEEMELYLKRIDIFKRQLISCQLLDATDEARKNHIRDHWNFTIVPFPAETAVLTSDSPSIWFSSSKRPDELCGVLMPITPLACFVGANRNVYSVAGGPATPDDALQVSINEIENCVEGVYFSDPLSDDEVATIRRRLQKRTIAPARQDGWQLMLVDYDLNPNLSFLTPK